jgi:type II secretory pathway component GspD/PulD (secretin)
VFQAKLRGWRRLAAGLVLVPGLTGLGADALGLLGRAAAQDRPAASADEARDLMRRAREAYDAQNYGLARELAEKAKALRAPASFDDDPPEDLRSNMSRRPAPKAAARPATTDPKVLLSLATQALEAGDLDRAQDLATQAQAHGNGVRWGLFDDTPASVLKDVQKARGRRDRDTADKLLADARFLYEKQAASRAERAANLTSAEEKAKQAAALHGSYSMWDFGDRPADVITDVRKAREKEKLAPTRPTGDGMAGRGAPRKGGMPDDRVTKTAYTGRPTDSGRPSDMPRPVDGTRKKAAIALMQEGKALEIGGHYAEARKKYVESARLNATFSRDEDTPEGELSRLSVHVQRKINAKVEEARSCIDRKDMATATSLLDEAHHLCLGMGLDASAVAEARTAMKPKGPSPIIRTGSRSADEDALPVIRTGSTPADGSPAPVIRSGTRPTDGPPMPVIRTGRRTGGDDIAGEKPLGGPVKLIPPASTDTGTRTNIVGGLDLPPPLPPVPDVKTEADVVKPPKAVDPIVAAPPPMAQPTDKGLALLNVARTEMKRGETETAKKIAIELLSGPYSCKEEAAALLKSIETKEAEQKIVSARRAFENGLEAYHTHSYAQALAIFRQIDGTLLPSEMRKKLGEMVTVATLKNQEMVEAAAARTGAEKLPTAPKPAGGVPDLPIVGPAPVVRNGSDNLLKQQEALAQVEFQRLRAKSLKVESEATARFGRGETDAALQDLMNFVAEVKASALEPSKQNLLCRPVEARMDRLKILKHQTDFLTKESRDRRNFKAEMTQEALYTQKKHEEVAQLMKAAHKLMDDAKYKEAYVELQKAQSMDPDDPSVTATLKMADMMFRRAEWDRVKKNQERFNWETGIEWHDFPNVNSKDPLKWTDDKEYKDRVMKRGPGTIGVMRSRSEAEKSIERKLTTPVSVNFKATSLESAVEHLQTMTGINFDLDLRGLKESQIDPKQPISANLKDVSLKSALTIICQQAGLKHVIENEAIRVTTPKNAAGRQVVRSIPVGDLVIPAPNYGAHPGLDLATQLRDAADSAYGRTRMNSSSPRTPPGSLPGGSSIGSGTGLDLPGAGGRLRNTPMDGGANPNTGPTNGTLERELIRLITTTIKPDSWSQLGGEGSIEYYPIGLALVINQSPEVIEEVERLLESLRRLQDLEVSIEVKVVSLAETFYERIGVDFAMGIPTNAKPVGGPTTGNTISGISDRNFSGNVIGLQVPRVPTPDLDIPIRATSFARAVPPFGGFNNSFADGGISLGLAFLSDIQVQMFLEAAQGDTRTNVMQAPKLTALNGTSASMTVGDFQFFVTGIQVASVNGQLVFTPQNVPYAVGITQPIPPNASIQNGLLNFTPTAPQTPGLGLFIQPVVSADRRFVRLNIQQSFTNLISGTQQIPITTIITPVFENGGQGQPVPFTQFLQQPRFSNLETQTVVVVPDGGTVVMGGLKYMTEGRNEFGPPVLSKIPYLNRLFKNVAYGREGRSILIMVTPRVIINREEQERQTGVREDDFAPGALIGP